MSGERFDPDWIEDVIDYEDPWEWEDDTWGNDMEDDEYDTRDSRCVECDIWLEDNESRICSECMEFLELDEDLDDGDEV